MTWPPDEVLQEATKALHARWPDAVFAVLGWTCKQSGDAARIALSIPSLRRLAEENERLGQEYARQVNMTLAAQDRAEAAEQRVKELEQEKLSALMGYSIEKNKAEPAEQRADAYREALREVQELVQTDEAWRGAVLEVVTDVLEKEKE